MWNVFVMIPLGKRKFLNIVLLMVTFEPHRFIEMKAFALGINQKFLNSQPCVCCQIKISGIKKYVEQDSWNSSIRVVAQKTHIEERALSHFVDELCRKGYLRPIIVSCWE